MKGLLVALGVAAGAVALAAGALFALGRAAGVGPFAPGAPPSFLYLAISRSGEDGDAREVEVIDLSTGERQLFALDDRAFDIALSRDRRTLYVGASNGRIFKLDSVRGVWLGEIRLSTPGEVRRLVVLPDGSSLVAITTVVLDSSATLVDLTTGREKATLPLGNRIVGRSVARPDVILSVADRAGTEQLLTLSLDPFRVREETLLGTTTRSGVARTAAAALAIAPDGSVLALSPFSLRLTVLAPNLVDRRGADVTLTPGTSGGGIFVIPGFDGDVEVAGDGRTIHFCVGTGQRAFRFRAGHRTLETARTGTECGKFARLADGSVYLAVRGKAEVKVIDPASGEVRRTLPLAGFAQRVAY